MPENEEVLPLCEVEAQDDDEELEFVLTQVREHEKKVNEDGKK